MTTSTISVYWTLRSQMQMRSITFLTIPHYSKESKFSLSMIRTNRILLVRRELKILQISKAEESVLSYLFSVTLGVWSWVLLKQKDCLGAKHECDVSFLMHRHPARLFQKSQRNSSSFMPHWYRPTCNQCRESLNNIYVLIFVSLNGNELFPQPITFHMF